MSTQPESHDHSDDTTPALGSRENWWGDDPATDPPRGGHRACAGTDAAEFVAHRILLGFVNPICGETGGELSEPCFYLPKQIEIAPGQYIEYRNYRERRRIEPESGRINWGESTTTDLPEVGYETFKRAVHTYLAERDCRLTAVDDYLEHAERVWCDPQFNSHQALEQLVRYVRENEQ